MIVAGIGCRRGAPAAEVTAAITAALAGAGYSPDRLSVLATAAAKAGEHGVAAAAAAAGVPLVLVAASALQEAATRTVTRSERAMRLAGVPSVAEAAALAAAGPGAQLIAPRLVLGAVTCALAETAP
jgi:cobalt-precorrin 5A hydrolase